MEQTKNHLFKIGARYRNRTPKSPEEYLQAVYKAERTLRESQLENSDGIYWNAQIEGKSDLSLYTGSAGILFFYLQLYRFDSKKEYRKIIEDAAKYVAKHWRELPTTPTDLFTTLNLGFYVGYAGVGHVLCEVYDAFHNEDIKNTVVDIVELYRDKAVSASEGIYWSDNTSLLLDGGVILFLLRAYEILKDSSIKEIISAAADYLISKGIPHEEGMEFDGFAPVSGETRPNFEFGSAGNGFLFLKLYEEFKEEKYLALAKACADYVLSLKVPQEKGYLIPYTTRQSEPIYYLSTCHGPAGTSRLFYELYKVTGDESYLSVITDLTDGLEAVGAPEKQSKGFWNNVCLCCGNAGLVQFFVGMYQSTRKDYWLTLARRAGNVLLGESESDDQNNIYWLIAYTRVQPEIITKDLGYYNGLAGIAAVLLQLYLAETDKFQCIRLIDDPFPSK
ncbi:MAG: hypothetical protein J1D87_11625 [Lachnospiraceae bacterium]|nr:hypothetical protein [Lachnospiraceae bacterium]